MPAHKLSAGSLSTKSRGLFANMPCPGSRKKASRCSTARLRSRSTNFIPPCLRLHAERGPSRKLPAFHPFEKGSAGSGDVSEVPCHARVVQRGHGVPSPGHGDQRTFARERGGGF